MASDNDKSVEKPVAKKPEPEKPVAGEKDVVLMHSRTEDGEGIRVIRSREGRIEAGELRALKEGVPISGEVVSLAPRNDQPLLWDVKVQCRVESAQSHAGPARVSSRAYRKNWDGIFKNRALTAEGTEDESLPN